MNLAVFASGSGSNFQSIIDRFAGEAGAVVVALLVASRPGIGAIARANARGIPVAVLPEPVRKAGSEAEGAWLEEVMERHDIELVALAGFLRLVPERIVARFKGRMLNIHPSLLPAFGGPGMYGKAVHEAVVDRGCRVSGATVHFVSEEYDEGPIVMQWPVLVKAGDTPEDLAARVLAVEHSLYPSAIEAVATGKARLGPDGRCQWTTDPFFST